MCVADYLSNFVVFVGIVFFPLLSKDFVEGLLQDLEVISLLDTGVIILAVCGGVVASGSSGCGNIIRFSLETFRTVLRRIGFIDTVAPVILTPVSATRVPVLNPSALEADLTDDWPTIIISELAGPVCEVM
ncbi:unnamed protein product [Cylicostephanus goldi]|uniref:Uncharacterized protein n=1 Tax=Cylicostephanus goldi TaxID=71465 RepID=A0A3P6R5A0_CYLGO|nr:unnamed protein product [Cylicostephanus goldi]